MKYLGPIIFVFLFGLGVLLVWKYPNANSIKIHTISENGITCAKVRGWMSENTTCWREK
jgi:hypothetical protein